MRYLLPAVLLLVVVVMLLLRGYVHSEFLADHRVRPPVATDAVPEKVLSGGPVVDARGAETVSHRVPDHKIVLTFDDGPDPEWTPKILDKLAEHHAHAVFFVTGTMTARYPDLVRRMIEEGHEVGLHTFNHPDLSYQSSSRIQRELAQSQLALAGAAGVRTSLFRPPYSSTADALDDESWPVVREIADRGYITAFIDTDSEDWARPGVDEIVRRAMPKQPGKGAIVLMHDSGGDRSQTVAALDRMLPQMRAEGYEFPRLTEALGSPSPHTAVHGKELWQGRAFVGAVGVSDSVMGVLVVALIVVGALVVARFAMMLVLSTVHARRVRRLRGPPGKHRQPVTRALGHSGKRAHPVAGPVTQAVTRPVTVLVPAYNERECIARTVRSLAANDHPLEVIVIDDGSTDGTAEIVEALRLPGVRVLCQANAGKAAALNNGLRHAAYDLIVMMDGDTVFEPSTVRELVQPFADPRVGAVAGNAKVGNRRKLIGAWQHIEYVMGFNLDRRMYDVLRCMPTIPGAVGAFRRTALQRVGGMSDDTLAEDTDVTMALHRDGWRVVYEERARAWTEAPGTVRQLWSQRYRWSYGTMQAIWKHRRAVLERGPSGRFGRVGLPLVAMFTVLAPLLAPLIDVFLVYGVVFGPALRTAVAWLAVLVVQGACAAYAFRLDRERLTPLLTLPLQQLLYRQLMYVVLMQSWITALTGGRLRWQKLRRTGQLGAAPDGVGAQPAPRHLPEPEPEPESVAQSAVAYLPASASASASVSVPASGERQTARTGAGS
ncbi:glycosyltransferase [Streptomyces winkii]|uniref:glycosyltransferase n=1 Tax=Streptomyces winkii TaxID=3051178 RepID=UPI0037DA761A